MMFIKPGATPISALNRIAKVSDRRSVIASRDDLETILNQINRIALSVLREEREKSGASETDAARAKRES